ncbi:MAG: NAD(P)H-hydrate dehydratase [Dehalococcoidia bacterium]|nr:NAD(P)H-hydrate dehydratase [Dehalococcoidia bacterium]
MKILTSQQMRDVEEAAARRGASLDALMEQAGLAVARQAQTMLDILHGTHVLILVGPGNNGDDGLVAARVLRSWGAAAQTYLCAPRRAEDPKLEAALKEGVQVTDGAADHDLQRLRLLLKDASLVIDAVLGIGSARPLSGSLADVLRMAATARAARRDLRILAVDVPTGLNATTGEADLAILPADVTITFGAPKAGQFLFPGAEYVGQLKVSTTGFLPEWFDSVAAPDAITADLVRALLPARSIAGHKGMFGKVFVLAGSQSYLGAAYLACMGAARTGAGYVTLAMPFRLQAILATKLTEATYVTLPETPDGALTPDAPKLIREALNGYDALLIGPGLGQHPATVATVRNLLLDEPVTTPVVIDADALNALAKTERWWERLCAPAVLTPHPGEMARLLNVPLKEVEEHRWNTALESARTWNASVVLKGAFTAVGSPHSLLRVSPFANPALATAGTGDVLAGVIAGLLAQGLPPYDAASAGVYLHATAGELMRQEIGDAGAIASDLLPRLPQALHLIKEGGTLGPI